MFGTSQWNSTGDSAPPPVADSATAQAAPPASPPTAPPVAPPVAPPAPGANSSLKVGTAVVLVGASATLGWLVGGLWGAGAGALWMGAARNGLRSRDQWQTDRSSAAKTASLAVIGAALGGYMAYRAYQSGRPRALE